MNIHNTLFVVRFLLRIIMNARPLGDRFSSGGQLSPSKNPMGLKPGLNNVRGGVRIPSEKEFRYRETHGKFPPSTPKPK